MTIVTKNPHTWFTVESDSGEKQVIYNDEHYLHNYLIGFEVPFSDSSTCRRNGNFAQYEQRTPRIL